MAASICTILSACTVMKAIQRYFPCWPRSDWRVDGWTTKPDTDNLFTVILSRRNIALSVQMRTENSVHPLLFLSLQTKNSAEQKITQSEKYCVWIAYKNCTRTTSRPSYTRLVPCRSIPLYCIRNMRLTGRKTPILACDRRIAIAISRCAFTNECGHAIKVKHWRVMKISQ